MNECGKADRKPAKDDASGHLEEVNANKGKREKKLCASGGGVESSVTCVAQSHDLTRSRCGGNVRKETNVFRGNR